jgi:hypothetical protein
MVAWNDKRPGARLGPMDGLVGLTVWCTACGRHGDITKAQAHYWWGVRTRTRDVARDLRCKVCGAKRAEIKVHVQTWAEYRAEQESSTEEASD